MNDLFNQKGKTSILLKNKVQQLNRKKREKPYNLKIG